MNGNEFNTGIFYSAALGKQIGIFPKVDPLVTSYSRYTNSIPIQEVNRRIREKFSLLTGHEASSATIKKDLQISLGTQSFRSPSAIKEMIPVLEINSL